MYAMNIKNDENSKTETKETTPEEVKPQFAQAKSIKLYDEDGNELVDYQGIVNKVDQKEVFNVVSRGYKIVQHDDADKNISEAIGELELKTETRRLIKTNSRLKTEVRFPDISCEVDGQKIDLAIQWDNSYDGTTGLRMLVAATSSLGIRYSLEHKAYGKYYHRHTKNVSTNEMKRNVEKGILVFEKHVKEYFDQLIHKSVTQDQVLLWIQDCRNDKVIADCYLEKMLDVVKNKSRFPNLKSKEVTSAFRLFTLIAEVIQTETQSVDTQDRYMKLLSERMNKL